MKINTSTTTNWILFFLATTMAMVNIYYFINLTGWELDRFLASALALQVPASKMHNMDNEQGSTPAATGAILATNYGNIEIAFRGQGAPQTVANFVKLARAGFYDGTKFHRVIQGFMIQVGDPLSKDDTHKELWGTGGPGYKFDD